MIAFELTAEYAGSTTIGDGDDAREVPTFQGAVLAVGDASFDVGKAIAGGIDGVFVVDDRNQTLVDLLDAYPALKRTKVPEGARPLNAWRTLPKAVLQERAAERGLSTSGTQPELAARLERHDQLAAGQEVDGDGEPTLAEAPGMVPVAPEDTTGNATAGDDAELLPRPGEDEGPGEPPGAEYQTGNVADDQEG